MINLTVKNLCITQIYRKCDCSLKKNAHTIHYIHYNIYVYKKIHKYWNLCDLTFVSLSLI